MSAVETLPSETLVELASSAPPMPGGEYLNRDVLAALWDRIDTACRTELADAKQTLQEFLKGRNPAWHLIGRVHFNLAENRSDEESPFAFIATYTTRLTAQSRAGFSRCSFLRFRAISSTICDTHSEKPENTVGPAGT